MTQSAEGSTQEFSLLSAVDWFVPPTFRSDIAKLWKARIFVVSHLVGPCFGAVIVAYLRNIDADHLNHSAVIGAGTMLFWLLPVILRQTGNQQLVAMISVATLTFVALYGSYFYGGMSSPFLSWVLVALLNGFFYLGENKRVLLGIFSVLASSFAAAYWWNQGFPEHIAATTLVGMDALSVGCATAYTSMMAAYYAQVLSLQSHLEQEASRHLALTQQLRWVNEAAERANAAKSVFIAKMSHELRTPLNAVIGYSEILMEDDTLAENSEHTANLARINKAGKHLLSLVTDVLDLSKLDRENFAIELQEIDVRSFVDDVGETCRSLVLNNGNQYDIRYGDNLGTIVCDPRRLRQVVFNLLSNAGKFTRRGSVTLSVVREAAEGADVVRISVRDTGIGIERSMLHKLFKDFNQIDAATASKFGGTGLGLAVSQGLCRLMGGDITVESEAGKGSCFTATLPAVQGGSAAAAHPAPGMPAGTELAA